MNKSKAIIVFLTMMVIAAGIFMYLIFKEKSQTVPEESTAIQQPVEKKEEPKPEAVEKEEPKSEEINQEKPADPELVTVRGLEGSVVKVDTKTITINTGEKEETFNLLEQGLGVFKKSDDGVSIIKVTEIKPGDQVKLEARQSDGMVNAIMVE